MKQVFDTLKFKTNGKQLINITEDINHFVNENLINDGLLNLSILHTSASLLIQENADETVLFDLLNFFNNVTKNIKYFHDSEGEDDMPAHIRSALTQSNLSLSINKKNIILGLWQGIFLFEHREQSKTRSVFAHIIGR